jgi:hypothetical protein
MFIAAQSGKYRVFDATSRTSDYMTAIYGKSSLVASHIFYQARQLWKSSSFIRKGRKLLTQVLQITRIMIQLLQQQARELYNQLIENVTLPRRLKSDYYRFDVVHIVPHDAVIVKMDHDYCVLVQDKTTAKET